MPQAGRQIALAVAGLALATAGAWATYEESAPYLSGETSLERAAAWAAHPTPSGLSIAVQKTVMLDCLNALVARNSLSARYLAQEERAAIAPTCLAIADRAVEASPSFSYAWLVGARASADLGDMAGMNRRLLSSQQTGPVEQWIAEARVALAEEHFEALDPAVLARHKADLGLLARSGRGTATIALRYVSDPAFRERITAIVETAPDADQRRFLANVRHRINLMRAAP